MDNETMNELQRSLGRIEGNQHSFYQEFSQWRMSMETRSIEVEHKVEKLDKFKNHAAGVVSAVMTAMSVVLGLHIKGH